MWAKLKKKNIENDVFESLINAITTNTIEPEDKFLPQSRPSIATKAQPRALREVCLAVETKPRALLYLVVFFDGAFSLVLSSGKNHFVEKDERLLVCYL